MEKCRLIIDTNLWISLLIGKKVTEMRKLCTHKYMSVYICKELVDEFVKVASKPKIRKYATEQNVAEVIQLMEISCTNCLVELTAESTIRHPNDLYLLSLADTVNANYIITGDEDLLVLQRHHNTRIVTFTDFMTESEIQ
jgi:putative PIN family toxin of toxin-antitoxin system